MTTEDNINKIIKAIIEIVINSPLLLLLGGFIYCEGSLVLVTVYKFENKRINKILKIKIIGKFMPLIIGLVLSIIVFIFQNIDKIIKSEMTIELMRSTILSSVLLSFAIFGAVCMVVLIIREKKRLKGDNGNNGS